MEKKDFALYIHDDKKYSDISLYECGYEKCAPGHSFGPNVRHFYLLHFVISGRGVYHIQNKTFNIESGMCFMIPPGLETTYIANEVEPWEYYWIGLHGLEVKGILEQANLNSDNYTVTLKKADKIFDILDRMISCEKHKLESKYFIMGYLYQVIALLVEGNIKNHKISSDPENEIVQTFIRYVENNYSKRIKIVDFTEEQSIERTLFTKIFKKIMDVSPKSYIINFRLSKALVLLKDPKLNILDVSYMVGFHDYKHFLKTFRDHYGVTPKKYRKDPFETS
jgi:AraC-like DNA-binding protein